MGLMNKLKNILFEEEEVEIPIIEKKEKKPVKEEVVSKEMPKVEKVEKYNSSFYDDLAPAIEHVSRLEEEAKKNVKKQQEELISDREMFGNERTFNFPAFDEEEFQSVSKVERPNNVLERERKKTVKREYREPQKREEAPVQAKFKPSPIISPVYGILDKNYTPDDITSRTDTKRNTLDVDSVRKKAFGNIDKKEVLEEAREKELEDKILEEKLEKARTIDELLKDSSDEVIAIDDDIKEEDYEEELKEERQEDDAITSLDQIKKPQKKEDKTEDTLENDLFDLIDSMYENREDGE